MADSTAGVAGESLTDMNQKAEVMIQALGCAGLCLETHTGLDVGTDTRLQEIAGIRDNMQEQLRRLAAVQ